MNATPPILQDRLREMPWMDPRMARLPGIQPLAPGEVWLRVDEAYAAQMAERERLMATIPDRVHAVLPQAFDAAVEVLDEVQALLPGLGFRAVPGGWLCPDGRRVTVDRAQPLLSAGRLVQEDLVVMLPGGEGGEHVLAGAILCFPASWTLAEKLGRPLTPVHRPVEGYAGDLARRVQRLFDAIRVGQPLWRANGLAYADPALHQPRREGEAKPPSGPRDYIRTERQCLVRLPRTQAVLFSIHTTVVLRSTLSAEEEARFVDTHAGAGR